MLIISIIIFVGGKYASEKFKLACLGCSLGRERENYVNTKLIRFKQFRGTK
jgi:hypothetical protein